MNDRILQKLLKLIAKTQEVLTEDVEGRQDIIDSEVGVCCFIDFERDPVTGIDVLPRHLTCQSIRISRAVCENDIISEGTGVGVRGVFWTDAAWSSRQLNNPKLPCCYIAPITDTSGGQFVPVEA